ncbi:MAG: EscU/YscU/HrcU family type III secretion system export apparatus switch protein [Candidatus Sericytochromatia bacterium]|nr:EscU/YscU/HrcU family type III secretion system export apparatus switch protein [Candidatus Sericytochromatia bacterium]
MADEDKRHDPTPHKLDEERKKGNVLKVQDLLAAAIIFVSAYALAWSAEFAYQYVYAFIVEILRSIPEYQGLSVAQARWLLWRVVLVVVISTTPFVVLILLTVLVVLYAQVGFLITFKPLEPKYEKIDPVNGFKNKVNPFKVKQLFNLVKTLLVCLVIGYLVFDVVRDNLATILQSATLSVTGALGLIGFLILEVAKKVALFMLVVAFVSYLFERWQWWKGLKMSDKEIKDEYKKLEGDPHIKGKQRQKMMEISSGAMREVVPNADVVVTNPTHFAVALEYKPKRGMKAPKVLAKGKGRQALLIRQIAEENFIPTVEDPPTARALYDQVKVGQSIPPELFVAVAKIIATIMRKRQRPAALPVVPSLTGYVPALIEPAPPPARTQAGSPPSAAASEPAAETRPEIDAAEAIPPAPPSAPT